MKNKKTWKLVMANRQLYLMLLLPVIYIIVFSYVPMAGIQIAFKDYSYKLGIWGSEWVGFEHFREFLGERKFLMYVRNTLSISVYTMVVGNVVPLTFALFLNILKPGIFKKSVETISYLPHFISVVVLCGILIQMLNPIVGLYGTLGKLIIGETPKDILSIPQAFTHIYVWSGVWQNLGWNSIIYTAALAGCDQQLHEAAQIDGASRLQRVWHIDLPVVIPTFVIMLIMNAGRIMSVGFEKVFLLQNQLNLQYSEIISTYVYKQSFASARPDFGYSTAISLFNSVINIILLSVVNKISSKVSETSLW